MSRRLGWPVLLVVLIAGAGLALAAEPGKGVVQRLRLSTLTSVGRLSPYVYGEWVDPGAQDVPALVSAGPGPPVFVEVPWRPGVADREREVVLDYLRGGTEVCLTFAAGGAGDEGKILEVAGSFPEVRFASVEGLSPEATRALADRIESVNPGSSVLMAVAGGPGWEASLDSLAASPVSLGVSLPGREWRGLSLERMQERVSELRGEGRKQSPLLLSRWVPREGLAQCAAAGFLSEWAKMAAAGMTAASADLSECAYWEQAHRILVLLGRETRCYGSVFGRSEVGVGPPALAVGEPFRVVMLLVGDLSEVARFEIAGVLEGGYWSRRAWSLPLAASAAPVWEASLQSDGKNAADLSCEVAGGAARVVVLQNDLCWTYRQMRQLIGLLKANVRGDQAGLQSLVRARAAVERAILEWRGGFAHQVGLIHEALAGIDEAGVLIGPVGVGALGELSADMAAETQRALEAFHDALSQASADYLGLRLTFAARPSPREVEVEVGFANGNVAGLEAVGLGVTAPVGWRVRAAGETSAGRLPPGRGMRASFALEPSVAGATSGLGVLRLKYRVTGGVALVSRPVAVETPER